MTDWVRLWHDMPTDPKWRVIAKKAGASISEVIAIFNFVIVNASANASERGRTHNLFADDVAAALDIDEDRVDAVFTAMQGKVMDNDGRLSGWQKRQPKREDNSADRARAWRDERKRTQANASERPETETETDITLDKSSVSSTKRASRLDGDFIVPTDWIEWAMSERSWPYEAATAEAESFVDYWHAKPGRDGTKLDWFATWRNWVRNSRRLASVKPLLPL